MIVTAGAAADHVPAQKIRWCKKYLDLPLERVIVTPRKELVRGDVLIDDSPEQVRRYKANWPTSEILSIAYPYNECVEGLCCRWPDWRNTAQAWREIVYWID